MRITDIRTYLVNANTGEWTDRPRGRNWLFVSVHTDAGLVGYGEGGGWPEVVERGIQEVKPLLIGQDPFEIERIWLLIYQALHGHGITGAVRGGVQSAIDIALWDLKGKALGVPVYELLGGKLHETIQLYTHANSGEEAARLREKGYTAFKCVPSVAVLKEIRKALGSDVQIGLHCHGEFSVHAAIRLATAAEPYCPDFLEEPTAPESIEALVAVAQKVQVPLAAGERLFNKWSILELLQSGAVALVQPETTRLGGITELKKVSALAEAFGVRTAPHDGSVGPIVELAKAHVMATTSSFLYLEHKDDDVPWRYKVIKSENRVRGGEIALTDAPGLGIELDIEEIERHPAPAIGEYRFRPSPFGGIQRWR